MIILCILATACWGVAIHTRDKNILHEVMKSLFIRSHHVKQILIGSPLLSIATYDQPVNLGNS